MQNWNNNTTSNNKEAIVAKLQETLATFRRERDELHRKKQLSAERLRMICEERDALEKTVNALKDKLSKLNAQASGEAEQEVEELAQKVKNLTREVQFQHAELVSKRAKVAELQKNFEKETYTQESVLRGLTEQIRKTRERIASLESPTSSLMKAETQMETIQREMQDCNSARLWLEWPVVIEQKAASITMEAVDLHRSSEALERVLAGYKKHFGVTVEVEEDMQTYYDAMEQ